MLLPDSFLVGVPPGVEVVDKPVAEPSLTHACRGAASPAASEYRRVVNISGARKQQTDEKTKKNVNIHFACGNTTSQGDEKICAVAVKKLIWNTYFLFLTSLGSYGRLIV